MNIVLALCVTALHRAAPLSGRSLEPRHKSASHEPALHASHETEPRDSVHDNISDLLIPLLERSFDNKHEGKHKKVVQVLPYDESKVHENKGWRKLKTNTKQLVEITPLRRKVGDNKRLAYILSAAKPVEDDIKDSVSSEENSFEDSIQFEDDRSEPTHSKHRLSAEDKVSSEIDAVLTDNTHMIDEADDTLAISKSFEEAAISKEPHSDENKEVHHMISDEIVIARKSEEQYEPEHVQDSESTELSVSADSHDFQFGPGNNILFDRGSSESDLEHDVGEAMSEDVNRSNDVDADLAGDVDSSIHAASSESISDNTHEFDEVTRDQVTLSEYEVEVKDTSAGDDPDDTNNPEIKSEDVENDIVIDRSGNNYHLESKDMTPNNSKDVIEVLRSVEEEASKYNCNKAIREGEEPPRSGDHKSYHLSFLFNK